MHNRHASALFAGESFLMFFKIFNIIMDDDCLYESFRSTNFSSAMGDHRATREQLSNRVLTFLSNRKVFFLVKKQELRVGECIRTSGSIFPKSHLRENCAKPVLSPTDLMAEWSERSSCLV